MSLKASQITRNNLLNWVFQDKDPKLSKEPEYVFDMFLDHIQASYDEWNPDSELIKIQVRDFNKNDYDLDYFSFLFEIEKEAIESNIYSHFLIHGSCADLKIVKGWSDFDSIAVLKSESLNKENRKRTFESCLKIDKIMRKMDPYQHHGVHFLHEKDLLSFPNLYLPCDLLKDSKCILSSKEISLGKCDSHSLEKRRFHGIINTLVTSGKEGILRHHAKDGKYLLENYEDINTMYQLKYLLSVIMLLPTLWLNLRGNYCRKEDSYKLIRNHFSSSELEILEIASNIRSQWKEYFVNENIIPDQVKNTLGLNYLKRAAKYAKLLEQRLVS